MNQQAQSFRLPRDVAVDLTRMANIAAATGTPEYYERLDALCVEWLASRQLDVTIRQDGSGQSVEVAKAG